MSNKRPHGVCECGEHAWTALTQGYVAFVDPSDIALLSDRCWMAHVRSKVGQRTYVRAIGAKKRFGVKPLATAITGQSWTDHTDTDPLNCRRSNLRPADAKKNAANRRPKVGKTKGVFQRRSGRWSAQIWQDGHNRRLGMFDTEIEAAAAYNAEATRLRGEFAWLNPLPTEERRA